MTLSLLSVVNGCQDRIGLPRSTTVIGNSDENVRALLGFSNVEGRELAKRATWQALTVEKTFTSIAAETQTGVIPADFDRFINETFFNRTRHRYVEGPLTSQDWQAQKGITASVLTDAFRIRGNSFLLIPTPSAGDTYAYEYVSKYWVDTDADLDGDAEEWAADANTSLLSEYLIGLGTEWRFRQAKGMDYGEIFRIYETQVTQAISRDGAKRSVSMAGGRDDGPRYPVVIDGDWPL